MSNAQPASALCIVSFGGRELFGKQQERHGDEGYSLAVFFEMIVDCDFAYNVLCDNWLCVVIDFVYQAIDCGCCEGERGMLLLQQRNQNRILTNKK